MSTISIPSRLQNGCFVDEPIEPLTPFSPDLPPHDPTAPTAPPATTDPRQPRRASVAVEHDAHGVARYTRGRMFNNTRRRAGEYAKLRGGAKVEEEAGLALLRPSSASPKKGKGRGKGKGKGRKMLATALNFVRGGSSESRTDEDEDGRRRRQVYAWWSKDGSGADGCATLPGLVPVPCPDRAGADADAEMRGGVGADPFGDEHMLCDDPDGEFEDEDAAMDDSYSDEEEEEMDVTVDDNGHAVPAPAPALPTRHLGWALGLPPRTPRPSRRRTSGSSPKTPRSSTRSRKTRTPGSAKSWESAAGGARSLSVSLRAAAKRRSTRRRAERTQLKQLKVLGVEAADAVAGAAGGSGGSPNTLRRLAAERSMEEVVGRT
ncbi:uncharacterized protein BXZ73DRAFT_99947 [Epithele typhae]|uniref:uncharacterized protein n=1 Tax=Epithele typhae TaxID=378194 RepID=UPI00200855C1|nr:uncharacterized protein BXZ73DRAFT_99947 [Epithele typhae]KAH9938885.1 hypothetical protein BXZ73DRAFT_99947 [Epithele typhae]